MDAIPLPPWAQLLLAIVCVLAPSPIFDHVRRMRAPSPLSDEDKARKLYEAWASLHAPVPTFDELAAPNRGTWLQMVDRLRGVLLLLPLVALCSCSGPQRTAKHDLAAAVNSDADAIERFGAWDREKQLKIRARCEAQRVGEVECDKRLAGYRETRDALHALLKRSIVTLDSALKMLGAEEGRQ